MSTSDALTAAEAYCARLRLPEVHVGLFGTGGVAGATTGTSGLDSTPLTTATAPATTTTAEAAQGQEQGAFAFGGERRESRRQPGGSLVRCVRRSNHRC